MQLPTTVEELLRDIAANNGKLEGLGLADDEIVKFARAQGLIEVDTGNTWTLADTVSLTGNQRLVMGLPPMIKKPSAVAMTLNAVVALFAKPFGKRRPIV